MATAPVLFGVLCLLVCGPFASLAKNCALYDPPVPGLTCFHGDQVLHAITNSPASWMVEFYSSWCGHCQHFAPAMKELGKDVKHWSSVIKIGVVECTGSKENQEICTKFNVGAYPSIRFFQPNDPSPLKYINKIVGSRSIDTVRKMMVDHVSSMVPRPSNWPDLQPLQDETILTIPADAWKPTVLIFDDDSSYVGKELILDLSSSKEVLVHRVSNRNTALIRHYSILEIPSVVVEMKKDEFHIIDGQNFENPRKEFHKALAAHLQNKRREKAPPKVQVPAAPPSRRNPPQNNDDPPPGHNNQPPPDGNKLPPLPDSDDRAPPGGNNPPPPGGNNPPPPGGNNLVLKRVKPGINIERETKPHTFPAVRINRVDRSDVLNAVSYALRREVGIHSIVSGSAFSALLRFLRLLETAFSIPLPAASEVLLLVRTKVESRASSGFIVNRDWQRILEKRLDNNLFPVEPTWKNCNGSLPRYRGYPCGLWMLMHTVTILTLPAHTPHNLTFTSKDALSILVDFVRNFFSCELCRVHFTEMALTIKQAAITHDGDAILWLWEAHNVVNKRLIYTISSDPLYPKVIFPSYRVCPFCYQLSPNRHRVDNPLQAAASDKLHPSFNDTSFSKGESLVAVFMDKENGGKVAPVAADRTDESADSAKHVWNRTAILLYLWNFYHFSSNGAKHIHSTKVLHAAWPKLYKDVSRLHEKFYGMGGGSVHYGDHSGLGFNHVDKGICFMSYAMCVLFLVIIAYLLIRKRRLKRLFRLP